MLHNEARNFLVEAYEKTHDAKAVALACGISVPTVYRLAEQKVKTGSVDLRVSKRGRKRVLTPEDSEKIAKGIDGQPNITLIIGACNRRFSELYYGWRVYHIPIGKKGAA